MNVSQRHPTEPDGGGYIAQATFHQDHICCIDSHIRSGTNGNAQISPCQGGGVIDAITHHSHFTMLLELTDNRLFSVRQDPSDHMINAGLLRDGLGRTLVITSEHDHLDAHVPQLLNRLRAVFLDDIRHGNDTKQLLSLRKEKGCLASLSQVFCRFLHLFRDSQFSRNKRVISSVKYLTFTVCNQATSGQRLKVCSFFWCDLFFLSTL